MAKNVVRILNHSFTISSDDDQQYMEKIAAKVERKVKRLSDEMHTRNMTEVSLFVAMDYCDQYTKALNDASTLRGQIKEYLQESSFARKQLDDVKKENAELRSEIEALRKRLSDRGTQSDSAKKAERANKPDRTEKSVKTEKTVKTAEPLPVLEKPAPFIEVKTSPEKHAPIQGVFSDDAFSESADATAEIMSFFEQKAFMDDDDDE